MRYAFSVSFGFASNLPYDFSSWIRNRNALWFVQSSFCDPIQILKNTSLTRWNFSISFKIKTAITGIAAEPLLKRMIDIGKTVRGHLTAMITYKKRKKSVPIDTSFFSTTTMTSKKITETTENLFQFDLHSLKIPVMLLWKRHLRQPWPLFERSGGGNSPFSGVPVHCLAALSAKKFAFNSHKWKNALTIATWNEQ